MNTTLLKRPRGRPTNFDHEVALEKALQVFWSRGYEGASMSELTAALGINKPSIYAAFGNKEDLFRKALAKYLLAFDFEINTLIASNGVVPVPSHELFFVIIC